LAPPAEVLDLATNPDRDSGVLPGYHGLEATRAIFEEPPSTRGARAYAREDQTRNSPLAFRHAIPGTRQGLYTTVVPAVRAR